MSVKSPLRAPPAPSTKPRRPSLNFFIFSHTAEAKEAAIEAANQGYGTPRIASEYSVLALEVAYTPKSELDTAQTCAVSAASVVDVQ